MVDIREITEGYIHARLQRMFPFFICEGWAYKGFAARVDEAVTFIHLRFEKKIKGRMSWARLSIAAGTFDLPGFDLKQWITDRLQECERDMVARHEAEFAGAA